MQFSAQHSQCYFREIRESAALFRVYDLCTGACNSLAEQNAEKNIAI